MSNDFNALSDSVGLGSPSSEAAPPRETALASEPRITARLQTSPDLAAFAARFGVPFAAAPEPEELDLEPADLVALEASVCRESFADFVASAWSEIDPNPFTPTIASDALCAALQAVAEGRIKRLCIAIAPGLGKSTIVSVLYPCWRWARDPSWRGIFASYAHELATRDSRRCRRLIESPWFRERFGAGWNIRGDENRADFYLNTREGSRRAVGSGGALTGFRADEAVCDDPLNAIDARSKPEREKVNTWFSEGLATRVDGMGALVVVQQRLASLDLIGHLAASGEFQVLELASEFDPRRRCTIHAIDGSVVWTDPRTTEGELIAPSVQSREKLEGLKKTLGSAAYATQYGQAPSSDENAMFKRAWFRWYRADHAPEGIKRPAGCDEGPSAILPDTFDRVVISADLTFGSLKGDFAAIQAWGAKGGARYLLRQWRQRAGFDAQVEAIKGFAREYPGAKIIVEKAANGAAAIETLRKAVPNVVPTIPLGSKEMRAASIVPTVESGSVYLPEHAAFAEDVVEEFAGFLTFASNDDQVDAAVIALSELQGMLTDKERDLFERARLTFLRNAMTSWTGGPGVDKRRHVERQLAKLVELRGVDYGPLRPEELERYNLEGEERPLTIAKPNPRPTSLAAAAGEWKAIVAEHQAQLRARDEENRVRDLEDARAARAAAHTKHRTTHKLGPCEPWAGCEFCPRPGG